MSSSSKPSKPSPHIPRAFVCDKDQICNTFYVYQIKVLPYVNPQDTNKLSPERSFALLCPQPVTNHLFPLHIFPFDPRVDQSYADPAKVKFLPLGRVQLSEEEQHTIHRFHLHAFSSLLAYNSGDPFSDCLYLDYFLPSKFTPTKDPTINHKRNPMLPHRDPEKLMFLQNDKQQKVYYIAVLADSYGSHAYSELDNLDLLRRSPPHPSQSVILPSNLDTLYSTFASVSAQAMEELQLREKFENRFLTPAQVFDFSFMKENFRTKTLEQDDQDFVRSLSKAQGQQDTQSNTLILSKSDKTRQLYSFYCVDDKITSRSPFPNKKFDNFEDYYRRKKGVALKCEEMIRVKPFHTSATAVIHKPIFPSPPNPLLDTKRQKTSSSSQSANNPTSTAIATISASSDAEDVTVQEIQAILASAKQEDKKKEDAYKRESSQFVHLSIQDTAQLGVSRQFMEMLTYLPAILHRLDGNMIAYDLYCLIGLPVDPVLFLQAITSGNTQDSLIEFLEPLSNVTQPASGAIFPRYDPHNPDDVRKLNTLPFNYERLEFLGDTLIKYYVTAYLIADSCKNPNSPLLREEDITKRKTKIIRNDNLAELADSRGLGGYARFVSFSSSNWIVPHIYPRYTNMTSDIATPPSNVKADILESLIAAAHLSNPYVLDRLMCLWLGIPVIDASKASTGFVDSYLQRQIQFRQQAGVHHIPIPDKNIVAPFNFHRPPRFLKISELTKEKNAKSSTSSGQPILQPDALPSAESAQNSTDIDDLGRLIQWIQSDLQTKLGYQFKNTDLAVLAFTHPSWFAVVKPYLESLKQPSILTETSSATKTEADDFSQQITTDVTMKTIVTVHDIPSAVHSKLGTDYQLLEVLGDAVSDLLASKELFHLYLDKGPGDLTWYRQRIVSNRAWSLVALRLNLHEHILIRGHIFKQQIKDYSTRFDQVRPFVEKIRATSRLEERELIKKIEDALDEKLWKITDAPKVLGDVLEALVGALYIDLEGDLNALAPILKDKLQMFSRTFGF